MSELRRAIESAINCASAENGSNTPDFILAEFLLASLAAFDAGVSARERWYGIQSIPGRGTVPVSRPACTCTTKSEAPGTEHDEGCAVLA